MTWQSLTPRVPARDGRPVEIDGEMFGNDQYVVIRRRLTSQGALPDLVHLSIRRTDRGAARDWRHFQRIKNELVGPECEGVELYPAESRLADTSNQYHLWVFADPEFRLPFGFGDRLVMDADEASAYGAVQRSN